MAFTRTVSGLNNQHLFYNVDYIVYVEGGTSYSKDQIDAGMFDDLSIDTIFWEAILNHYKPANYKFKAIGSKTAVTKIAENIINSNITTVIAAMDQEFDMIHNTKLNHTNVLYTCGYSWENDVWNENVVEEVIYRFSAQRTNLDLITSHFNKFIRDIKIGVYTDAYLFPSAQSFFPRPGHMRLLECNSTLAPDVKRQEIITLINNTGVNLRDAFNYGVVNHLCCRKNCYGHLFGDFCKNLVKYILKNFHNLTGIGDEIIRRTALTSFTGLLRDEVNVYYTASII